MTVNAAETREDVQVTVTIPVHGGAAILERSIRSAILPTLSGIEGPVAKDASADPTAAVAEISAAKALRVNVLDLPALGGEQARANPNDAPPVILISPLPARLHSLRLPLHAVLARRDRPARAVLNRRQAEPARTSKRRGRCIPAAIGSAPKEAPDAP